MTPEDLFSGFLPEEPQSYFKGLQPDLPGLPRDIVFFLRRSYEKLAPGEPICHNRFNLVVNLGRSGTLSLDFLDVHLNHGDALLIFPRQVQIFGQFETLSLGMASFDLDADQIHVFQSLCSRPLPLTGRALNVYGYALEQYRRTPPDPNLVALYLESVLRELAQKIPAPVHALASSTPVLESNDARHFRRKLQTVIPQEGWNISVPKLAQILKLSESALHKKTRRLLGCSPGAFIESGRLLFALDLLRDSCLTIGQVALACEYGSAETFIRAFKKRYGITPGSWRKSHAPLSP